MPNLKINRIHKLVKTAQTALKKKTNGGVIYLLPQMLVKIIYLVPLMYIWKTLIESGATADLTLTQLLTYSYLNALLSDILVVDTFINEWDAAGKCLNLFTRPMSVYWQVISRTVGEWVPTLLMFSLPMALLAPFFGIEILPKSLWVIPSLFLCASLGFALEFLFFCITLRLQNVVWLTWVIRTAIVSFFSGSVIPFKILPFGMDRWMAFQPFGSLGGAFLSLYVGAGEPSQIIPLQIIWNIIFWLAALFFFEKSRERMVSFGG
ncbi:hypothetical protein LJC01_01485 [Clostridiaceae bacterium OttesenSCG-928-D20]|nr:hypothetical protein [Clostridiaceae bacterium OttesenSCG-928-D20]